MDDCVTPELRLVLEMLEQPAFLCDDSKVVFCNSAASKRMVAKGDRLDRILGVQFSLLPVLALQEQAQLTVMLCGKAFPATLARTNGRYLFVLGEPVVRENLLPDTLTLVAAQLRTQLNGLLDETSGLFSELAELENARIDRSISRINKHLLQILRLDANLRDASQIMQDREELYLERVEIRRFFAALAEEVGSLFQECDVRFSFTNVPEAFFGMLDRQKVERGLLNLLSNALKFTPKGGTVSMSVERRGGILVVRISDNGEGIASDVDVFSSYRRHEFVGDPRRGIGFGLPIATHYARLHGGSVIQESRKGGGATFVFCIRIDGNKPDTLASPLRVDYTSGYCHALVELSDALPAELFQSVEDLSP